LHNWYNSPKAKPKYTDAGQLFLMLHDKQHGPGHERGASHEFLSSSIYAKMEKIDPFHRNLVFFFTPDGRGGWQIDADNVVATAFREYMLAALGVIANPIPSHKAGASFYEWLEYHPICTGTPKVTPGFNTTMNDVFMMNYTPLLYPI